MLSRSLSVMLACWLLHETTCVHSDDDPVRDSAERGVKRKQTTASVEKFTSRIDVSRHGWTLPSWYPNHQPGQTG